jgi:hypothetical protein
VANKSTHSDSLLVHRDETRTVTRQISAGSLHNRKNLENKLQQSVTRQILRLHTRHVMRNFLILHKHLLFRLNPKPLHSNFRKSRNKMIHCYTSVNPLTPNDLQIRRAVSPLKIKILSKNIGEKPTNAAIIHSVY